MLSGMNGVPSEIGADVNKNSLRRASEMVVEPAGGYRLMGAVFRDMPADQIAVVHEKLQTGIGRANLEGGTPGHQPRGKKHGCAANARDTDHRPAVLTSSSRKIRQGFRFTRQPGASRPAPVWDLVHRPLPSSARSET